MEEPYANDEEFQNLCDNVKIEEFEGGIQLVFNDDSVQKFYISNNADVLLNCNDIMDVWFCREDSVYPLSSFIGVKEQFENKSIEDFREIIYNIIPNK